jgi:SAM-dependent methyltransferase
MTAPTLVETEIAQQFIDISLRPRTMFYYVPRTAILAAFREVIPSFSGQVLDLGCGFMPYRELVEANGNVEKYTGIDLDGSAIYGSVKPDITWDGSKIPLNDGSMDCVFATEFLEHHSEPLLVLSEIHRVLTSGGLVFATVPFIWNLHEIPHDEYRYTPYSIVRLLSSAGFSDVRVTGLGGWNAAMAQMIGLWVTFAKMPQIIRRLMRVVLFPIFVLLVKTDRRPLSFDDSENSMFTGLSITARK